MNDDNLLNNSTNDNQTYHATKNLNTAIENPTINMNSAVGVNIKDVEANTFYDDRFSNSNDSGSYSDGSAHSDSNLNSYDLSSFPSNSVEPSTSSQISTNNTQFVPNFVPNENNFNTDNVDERVVYEPTLEEKKRHNKFMVPRELKILVFIAFILFIFILLVPYVYDFFKGLELALTR